MTNDSNYAWGDDLPTPRQELAKAMAREATNASASINAAHELVDALRAQLKTAGADANLIFKLDQAVWDVRNQVTDLAALIGVEVGQRFNPSDLYDDVLAHADVCGEYGITFPRCWAERPEASKPSSVA